MLPLQVFLSLLLHASREYKTMQPDLSSKIKKTCHTASQTTTLASNSNRYWLQTCSTCFSTLWWFSASVSLFKARHIYQPSWSLRSSNDRLLRVPHWKLKSFRYRSFSCQGPVVWNSLPTDLKLSSSLASFKSKLKTHLFKKSYSLCWDNCHRCYWSYRSVKKDVGVIQALLFIVLLLLLLLLSLLL